MRLSDAPAPHGTPRKPPVGNDYGADVGSTVALPNQVLTKARRAVASRAADVDDARLLLDILELLPKATPAEATP